MARFEGSTSGAAPLQLQLSTPATGAGSIVVIVGLRAAGENASGSASHPVVTRPSSIGTGTAQTAQVRSVPATSSPGATFLSSYTSAPSTPSPAKGAFNLPMRRRWEAAPGDGLVVGGQGVAAALLLFADATGGHTWNGSITWEEL